MQVTQSDFDKRDNVTHFLVHALGHGHLPDSSVQFPINIDLKVNGMDVDFKAVLSTVYENMVKSFDGQVREAALKLVKGSRLRSLLDELEASSWRLEEILNDMEIKP